MSRTRIGQHAVVVAVSALLTVACTAPSMRDDTTKATEGFVIEDVNKLFVVDCLLPGQVRKLGSQMTFLSQRRPIRTTAADCEVRGGEYVAYDRANYASALKIWLPKAQEGDASAQLYVGEIYEKGLGQQTDYGAAAQWYKKSAEQGNSQAQLNLGHLYEKGLGVPKDPNAAMQWYRKASGLDTAGLQFKGAVEVAAPLVAVAEPAAPAPAKQAVDDSALRGLKQDADRSRAELEKAREVADRNREEAERLRAELRQSQQQLLDQQDALRHSQDELASTRERLQREQAASAAPTKDPAIAQLEQELRTKQKALQNQQAQVSQMTAALNRERQSVRKELDAAKKATQVAKASAATVVIPAVAPKPLDSSASVEATLSEKINAYQKKSAELTQWLTQSSTAGSDAGSVRTKIDSRKQELLADAREISSLKEKLEQEARKAKEARSDLQLAQAGPTIEIIDPPVTMTRGLPTLQATGLAGKQLVGRIRAADGIDSLKINDQPQPVDGSGMFRAPLDPLAKDSTIRIAAIDKRNQRSELLVSFGGDSASPADKFPTSVPSQLPKGDIGFGQFYALIIGNNNYSAYPTLATPVNDARSVDVVLRERYGFKTKVLLNANRHAIMTALNEMSKKLTAQDNLLVYYAGHGEIDKSSQRAYWLPTDAESGSPANWISSQSITEFLSIMPARHILVVADSCYAGALTGSAVARLPDGIDEAKREKWVKAMVNRKARTVLTSGGVKPVLDAGGGDHSVFAKAFLQVLRTAKGVTEDYEIFRSVANQVRSVSSRVGFEQLPQYAPLQHAGHEGSPFFFVPEA